MPSKNNVSALKAGQGRAILETVGQQQPQQPVVQTPRPRKVTAHRVNKGFQVEVSRAEKWDALVAHMKHRPGVERRTGPMLLDEAIDYLYERYMSG